MRTLARNADADDLDLPALDGGEEDDVPAPGVTHDGLELVEDEADHFDDAAAGDTLDLGLHVDADGPETGLLVDAEAARALDIGALDLEIGREDGACLLDDEVDRHGADDDLTIDDEGVLADAGEEGPLAEDEELREEDLPALDADEDGDVDDDDLYDRALLSDQEELRWDDRAWTRVEVGANLDDDAEDSGAIAAPGEDPAHRARDAAWRRLDETGRVTAAAFVPGDSVVVALATADWGRAQLVRITPDGGARIIAEVEPADDGDVCKVAGLRWVPDRGLLLAATDAGGACAFRPS